jgi:hypothetical protein
MYCQATALSSYTGLLSVVAAQRPGMLAQMSEPKQKQPTELPSEMRGLQGRLRYVIDTRMAEDAGLSQNEIARRADVDGGNLSAYAEGQRLAGIQAVTIVKLARALRVNVNWLLTGIEPSGLSNEPALTPIPSSAVRNKQ